ncbi:hypothetical protein Tco_1134164 [Tanacetum coccineum]
MIYDKSITWFSKKDCRLGGKPGKGMILEKGESADQVEIKEIKGDGKREKGKEKLTFPLYLMGGCARMKAQEQDESNATLPLKPAFWNEEDSAQSILRKKLQTFTSNVIGGTKLRWRHRRERKEILVVYKDTKGTDIHFVWLQNEWEEGFVKPVKTKNKAIQDAVIEREERCCGEDRKRGLYLQEQKLVEMQGEFQAKDKATSSKRKERV